MSNETVTNRYTEDGRMTRGKTSMVRDKVTGKVVARGSGLTQMQRALAEAYVRNGGRLDDASRVAGYTSRGSAYTALRLPMVADYIKELHRRVVQIDGTRIAWTTLEEVMQDKSQPGATRVRAAEVTLKWAREIGESSKSSGGPSTPADAKAMAEMTLEELSALVERLEAVTAEPEAIDITPQSDASQQSDGLSEDDAAPDPAPLIRPTVPPRPHVSFGRRRRKPLPPTVDMDATPPDVVFVIED